MPKRACPFPETFSSQYKIHVGEQELNNYGVFGNKYRQEIYAKTKNLLFSGAKAVMGQIWTGKQRPSGPAESPACSQSLLRGQTLIGHDGRLTRGAAAQGSSVALACCCVCQKSHGSRTPCSQCERLACPSCTRQCSCCSGLCCSVCTILDYSGQYDEVQCCSCAT